MRTPWSSRVFAVVIGGLAALATGCEKEFAHELPGAVWASGGAANVFQREGDVFVEGGSAPDGSGRLPDGNYVFAVTDVSGDVLLSGVREVRVDGGRLARVTVAPFDASENGVYKVWLTKASNFPGDGAGTRASGFAPLQSRTDTFRVLYKCDRDEEGDDGDDDEGDEDDDGSEDRDDGNDRDDGDDCDGGEGDRGGDDPTEDPTEDPSEDPTEDPTDDPADDDGDVDENGCDDDYGSRYGDTYGDIDGDVWGDVYGDSYGDLTGNHFGDTFGDIYGDITGNIYGDVYGDWYGDLNGNHYGRHFGDRYGDTNGDIGQSWVCAPPS